MPSVIQRKLDEATSETEWCQLLTQLGLSGVQNALIVLG